MSKIAIYGITLTVLVSVALFAPHSTAGDTYIEIGGPAIGVETNVTEVVKYTFDSGHYLKFVGRISHFDTEEDVLDMHVDMLDENALNEDIGRKLDFEYGFNFKPIDNLMISPHFSVNLREEVFQRVIRGHSVDDVDRWQQNANEYAYKAVGLDAKYSLPRNTYIAVNTEIGDRGKDRKERQYAWGVEGGWTDPKTRISVIAGYGASQNVSEKLYDGVNGGNNVYLPDPSIYISIGRTF